MSRTHKKKLSVVALSMLALVMLAVYWHRGRELPPADPSAQVPLRSPSQAALEELASANGIRLDMVRKQREAIRDAPSAAVRGFAQTSIEGLIDSAWVAHEARNMFNRHELQAQEYEAVGADPERLALAQAIATDVELAQEIYGDKQAFTRLYSVRIIGHLTTNGRPDLAATAIDRIGRKLNAEAEWTKGVDRDYVDLIASYAKALGKDAIMDDLDAFLSRIHFTDRTNDAASRGLWDSGILRELDASDNQQLAAAIGRHSAHGSGAQSEPSAKGAQPGDPR